MTWPAPASPLPSGHDWSNDRKPCGGDRDCTKRADRRRGRDARNHGRHTQRAIEATVSEHNLIVVLIVLGIAVLVLELMRRLSR